MKFKPSAYYGYTTRKQGSCPEKEIMQGTMPSARRRARPRTAWMNNIKMWAGLYKWREYVHGVANRRIKENRAEQSQGEIVRLQSASDREDSDSD